MTETPLVFLFLVFSFFFLFHRPCFLLSFGQSVNSRWTQECALILMGMCVCVREEKKEGRKQSKKKKKLLPFFFYFYLSFSSAPLLPSSKKKLAPRQKKTKNKKQRRRPAVPLRILPEDLFFFQLETCLLGPALGVGEEGRVASRRRPRPSDGERRQRRPRGRRRPPRPLPLLLLPFVAALLAPPVGLPAA